MYQILMKIDGMACSMCEAHVNDAIRNAIPQAKKVKSSHKTGDSSCIVEERPDTQALKKAIEETGYHVISVSVTPYEKKRFGIF